MESPWERCPSPRGALLAVTAFFRLGYGFAALTVLGGSNDLSFRYIEVHHWFAGLPVYRAVVHGDYPPASYAMLWPLIGWVSFTHATWIWAITSASALGLLAHQAVRGSGAATLQERAFVAMLPFPFYATQLTVWLGQLGLRPDPECRRPAVAAAWPASHAPAWLFPGGTPSVAGLLFEIGQGVLWLAALGYLLWQAAIHAGRPSDHQASGPRKRVHSQ